MLIKIKCVVGDCFERVAQKLGGRGCSANRWQTNVIKRDCNDTGHNPQPKSASRFHACSVSSGSSKMPSISCMWAGLIFRVVHPRSRRSVQDGISTVRQSHAYHEWSRITDHIMTHGPWLISLTTRDYPYIELFLNLHGIKWKYLAQPKFSSDLCRGEAPNAAAALQTSAAVLQNRISTLSGFCNCPTCLNSLII